MKFYIAVLALLLDFCSDSFAFGIISSDSLRTRLEQGDNFLLLDVREPSEYLIGHIAEPKGLLPFTPVNMPWASGVLVEEYSRLPNNIDIIVYCSAGGRSAKASAFLDSVGFTRIMNLDGGIGNWYYETREGGYGSNAGKWIDMTGEKPDTLFYEFNGKTSALLFHSAVLQSYDSVYFEFQNASGLHPVPPDAPLSDMSGLFRFTVLDKYGLSLFSGDSLVFSGDIECRLYPYYTGIFPGERQGMHAFIPADGWQNVVFSAVGEGYFINGNILRKWLNAEGFYPSSVNNQNSAREISCKIFQNSNNNSICFQYSLPEPGFSSITIFNLQGKLVGETLCRWDGEGLVQRDWNNFNFENNGAEILFYYLQFNGKIINSGKFIYGGD